MKQSQSRLIGAAALLSRTVTSLKRRLGRVMGGFWVRAVFATGVAASAGGCINIAAPEDPIVIELNVNIRAEVLYRLAEDANNTIDENADIF